KLLKGAISRCTSLLDGSKLISGDERRQLVTDVESLKDNAFVTGPIPEGLSKEQREKYEDLQKQTKALSNRVGHLLATLNLNFVQTELNDEYGAELKELEAEKKRLKGALNTFIQSIEFVDLSLHDARFNFIGEQREKLERKEKIRGGTSLVETEEIQE